MAEMRRNAIRRPSDEEDETPVAAVDSAENGGDVEEEDPGAQEAGAEPAVSVPVQSTDVKLGPDAQPATTSEIPAEEPAVAKSDETVPSETPKSDADRNKELTIRNLERIGKALVAYVRKNRRFPTASATGVSWRVELLPFLGKKSLYDQFKFDESPESDHNRRLMEQIPDVFRSAGRTDYKTNYLMVAGDGAVHNGARKVYDVDIHGIAVAIVEASDEAAVPWTVNSEYELREYSITETLGDVSTKGFFVVLADGGVRWISKEADDEQLYGLFHAFEGDSGGDPRVLQVAEAALAVSEGAVPAGAVASRDATDLEPKAAALQAAPRSSPTETGQQPATVTVTFGDLARGLRSRSNSVPSSLPPKPKGRELSKARDLLSELYKAEYIAAKTSAEKTALAKEMLERLSEIHSDLAGQYALLEIVQKIAVTEADVRLAMEAAELMAARFDLGDENIAVETLTSLGRNVEQGSGQRRLVDEVESYYPDLFTNRQFADAEKVSQVAVAAANRIDNDLADKWKMLHLRAEAARKAHLEASSALKVLDENPSDMQANTALGRYLCFFEGDWANGIPILAAGNDRSLKRLAELELAEPRDANTRLELADRWWKESKTANAAEELAMRKRAAHWYREALPGLPAGLIRLRAERRLKEIEEKVDSLVSS